jgi:Domain of unknown function (DUF4956)
MNIPNFMSPDKIRLGSLEIIDFSNFLELVSRFTLNFIAIMILVRWLYYSTTRRKDYLFTYILISFVVFLLCYLLESVKLQIGFALGLFAIFGIIRYRTNPIPIREMTYLFLVIGVSVINSLADENTSVADMLFTNAAIIFATFGLEKLWLLKHESSNVINYEKIELIKPENHKELIRDLQQRTGIKKIKRVDVGKIDFLRDTCLLTIYYEEPGKVINQEDQAAENNDNDDDD